MAPHLAKVGHKVVPVIPLPWVQHHEAKLAARKPREENDQSTSKLDDEPAKGDQQQEQKQPEEVSNTASEDIVETEPVEDTASSDSTPSGTEAPVESEPQTVMPTPTSAAPSLPAETPEKPSSTAVNGDQAEGSESDAQASSFGQEPSNGRSDSNRNIKDVRRADNAEAPAVNPNAPEYRPHAPAFRPAQQNPPPGFENTGDMNSGHYHPAPNGINGHSMHHAHPSNASAAHFSAFSGSSAAASPTPPHSGGGMMAPPPGMHLNGAQPPFMPSGANAYHNMSYGPDVMSGNGISGSEHHHNAGYGAAQSGHVGYGNAGQDAGSQKFQDQQHGVRHQQQLSNSPSDANLADYTRQMFMNPAFVDALLELRYNDGRPPIHLPGHRFIFSRSPVLSESINRADTHGGGRSPITVDIDSKWIRSDSLWMVLQTLYGHPLLPIPHHTASGIAQAGSSNEQLDFALSYAAAGQLLGWAPAMRRGAEITGELINFDNVDRVLEFALEGHIDFGTHVVYKHQLGAEIALAGVANFIANNLTPSFNIDDTASQHLRYSRLPIKPQPKSTKVEAPAPEEFHGESPTARGHRRQLSSIKFGDMSGLDAQQPGMHTPKASQPLPAHQGALSRALLNVPFGFLRVALDIFGARLAAQRGYIEPQHPIIQKILDARESERSRSIESLLGDGTPSRMNVVGMLRAPQPSNSDQWGILGWEESVSPSALPAANGGLGSQIQREWRPLWIPQRENEVAEFP